MCSVLYGVKRAHLNEIWACAWGSYCQQGEESCGEMEFLVTGGADEYLKIWDIHQNKLQFRKQLKSHSAGIASIAVSSNGKTIANTVMDNSLNIWDIASGEQKLLLLGRPNDHWAVALSPCSKYVITGHTNGTIDIYNIETTLKEHVMKAVVDKFPLKLAFTPDGKYIGCGSMAGDITLFDVTSGKVAHEFVCFDKFVLCLAFSPNSVLLIAGSKGGLIKIFDIVESCLIATKKAHNSHVLSAAFSKCGNTFSTSSSDYSVKLWSVNGFNCLHIFNCHIGFVWGVIFPKCKDRLISVSADNSINLYDCPDFPLF